MKSMRQVTVLMALFVCASMLISPTADAGTDDLLKFIPGDWPIIMRIDSSTATASGAYLKKTMDNPNQKELDAAANKALAMLLRSVGLEVDIDKGIFPWMGEQWVVGIDPMSKPQPGVIIAIASKDRLEAEKSLDNLVGSIIRNSDPLRQDVAGASIKIWKMPKENLQPAYAVGDNFVIFADNTSHIKSGLESSAAGRSPAAGEILKAHADDIIAFSVNTKPLISAMEAQGKDSSKSQEGPASMAMMFADVNAHGGLGVSDKGIVLTIAGDLPPMLQAVMGQLVSGNSTLTDVGKALPGNALAAVLLSDGSLTKPLQGAVSSLMDTRVDLGAAVLFMGSAAKMPVALALTGLIPQPNYVVVAAALDDTQAASTLGAFREALADHKMDVGTAMQNSAAGLSVVVTKEKKTVAGYFGRVGNSVFFASDYRSARKAAAVEADNCLAARQPYADMLALTGGPQTMNAWISLDGISALGYLYEAMGANQIPMTKEIADALKSTNGLGVSVGMTDKGAQIKMAMRTTPGPGTGLIMAYPFMVGTYAAALTGIRGNKTFPNPIGANKSLQSLNNLKQLTIAAIMYSQDFNDKLPAAANWKKSLWVYVKDPKPFKSPWEDSGFQYVFNPNLSGLKLNSIKNPAETILFVETTAGKLPSEKSAITPDGKFRVAYLDGHVAVLTKPPSASAYVPVLTGVTKAIKPKLPVKKAPSTVKKKK